jgi:hypothetical protein
VRARGAHRGARQHRRLRRSAPAIAAKPPLRAHYVKAQVRVHQYPDGGLAVFHGPRAIARYTSEGVLIEAEPSKLAA